MKSQLRQILEAITARLTDADFTVFAGGQLNLRKQELPVVMLHVGKEGVHGREGRTPSQQLESASIWVEHYDHIEGPHPLYQWADTRIALRRAIFDTDTKKPDTLGGLCKAPGVELQKSDAIFDAPNSDVMITQLQITIPFSED